MWKGVMHLVLVCCCCPTCVPPPSKRILATQPPPMKVNIDSKLVRERTGPADSDLADCLELQNGCACCNASDELLSSIQQLLRLSERRG
jgi:hypothetical protein